MKPLSLKARSGGFTLIELLVVIAIIGILGTLAAGAIFRVRGSQDQKNTEVAILKLGSALDMQVKASMDMVRDNSTIPPGVLSAVGGDPARARAVICKLRIRADFPQTVLEAQSISGVGFQDYSVGSSQTYIKKLANYTGGGTAHEESAICLHMILSQARRGVMFNADEAMGAGGLGNVRGMPVFMDKFGSPVGFRRWANPDTASSNVAERSLLNEINGNKDLTPTVNKDPFDPEGRLPIWMDTANRQLVNNALNTVPLPPPAQVINYLSNDNFLAFVYSLGKNKALDGTDGDDTFSFRLRKSGQRGGN